MFSGKGSAISWKKIKMRAAEFASRLSSRGSNLKKAGQIGSEKCPDASGGTTPGVSFSPEEQIDSVERVSISQNKISIGEPVKETASASDHDELRGKSSTVSEREGTTDLPGFPIDQKASISCFKRYADDALPPISLQLRPKAQGPSPKSKMRPRLMRKMYNPEGNVLNEIPAEVLDFVLELNQPMGAEPFENLNDQLLNPDHLIALLRDENNQLPGLIDGGRHTRYTYFAAQNRLDVVKEVFRRDTSLTELAELITLRTPASDGRTCLYWFAAWRNIDGVEFCVRLHDSAQNGWSAVVMAVLHAAAFQQHPLGHGDYCEFLSTVLQRMAAEVLNVAECLNVSRLNWPVLCPWLLQHEAGQSLLHYACQHSQLQHSEYQHQLRLLVEYGANPTLGKTSGRHHSSFDVCGEYQENPVAACRLLIELCQMRALPCAGAVSHLRLWLAVRGIPIPDDIRSYSDREL